MLRICFEWSAIWQIGVDAPSIWSTLRTKQALIEVHWDKNHAAPYSVSTNVFVLFMSQQKEVYTTVNDMILPLLWQQLQETHLLKIIKILSEVAVLCQRCSFFFIHSSVLGGSDVYTKLNTSFFCWKLVYTVRLFKLFKPCWRSHYYWGYSMRYSSST